VLSLSTPAGSLVRSKLKALSETSSEQTPPEGATAEDRPQTICVEFAPLNDQQQAFVDLHTLRAAGTEVPAVDTDGVVIEFWLREGDTVHTAYDDIRGWALGHSLPIRRLIGT
jgi:hypothetical protein